MRNKFNLLILNCVWILKVRFEPPTIVLFYREKGKLRNRLIPAKNIDILTDITLYAENFKDNLKYRKYFEKVSIAKLEKVIFILQDNMKGYTLEESIERAKKFDTKPENSDLSDLLNSGDKKAGPNDDYDDDDFHDTDEEDDKILSKSVSTIEEIKAQKNDSNSTIKSLIGTMNFSDNKFAKSENSKADALSLLSNQIKTVKSSIYDFEDDVEDEEDDDVDESSFLRQLNKKKELDEPIETEEHILTDESF